jgi:thiopurine S-methyltransferase
VPRLLVTLEYDQKHMAGPPFSVSPAEVHGLFGGRHRISELAWLDVLAQSPGLRSRGVTAVGERVYRLDPA